MASYYDIHACDRENLEVQAIRQRGKPEPLIVFRNSYRGTAEFSLTVEQFDAFMADAMAWRARHNARRAA